MARKKKKSKKRKTKKKKKTQTYDSTITGGQVGHLVFLAGVFIAIVAGIVMGINTMVLWILASLGLIVGLVNITLRDEVPFLVAVTVLIIASGGLNVLPVIGETIGTVLSYIVVFVAPAGLVVALKAIYAFARA